jgi:hypothetical protein
VVLVNEIQEPGKELGALFLRQAVDVLDVSADREDALPAGDRVGANDGMDSLELGADVLCCAARLVVQLEPSCLGHFLETWLLKRGRQGLEELLIGLADAVVDFVAGGPKGVYANVNICHGFSVLLLHRAQHTSSSGRQLNKPQRRIVGRDGFKGNIAVPLCAALLLGAEVLGGHLGVELFVLDGADGADLRIVATQLAFRVENGMDVQPRRRRPAGKLTKPKNQLLLQLVGQVILSPEEDDAALRN